MARARGAEGPLNRDRSDADPGRPLRIGLTGPIGCGKSTIARWLAASGGTVIDADALAREATSPGEEDTLARIRERFGDAVFRADGSLDRPALGRIVFADAASLRDLEAIVHPVVRRLIVARVAEAEEDRAPFITIEAIKLIEGGYAAECDEVWLVECSGANQRLRLRGRGLDAADAERRAAAQGADLADRLSSSATRRIVTDGEIEEVRRFVLDALADAIARHESRQQARVRGA